MALAVVHRPLRFRLAGGHRGATAKDVGVSDGWKIAVSNAGIFASLWRKSAANVKKRAI